MKLLSIPALLAVLLLAGCRHPGDLVPQKSTNLEVRAALGNPTDIRSDRNGDELWEYAGGREGTETYLVRLGRDGKVKEVTQLVTEERLMRVVPEQTTRPEVRDLLGKPSEEKMTGAGEAWSWRYDFGGGQLGHLVVTFNPDNTVKERMTIRDASAGDRDRGSK